MTKVQVAVCAAHAKKDFVLKTLKVGSMSKDNRRLSWILSTEEIATLQTWVISFLEEKCVCTDSGYFFLSVFYLYTLHSWYLYKQGWVETIKLAVELKILYSIGP